MGLTLSIARFVSAARFDDFSAKAVTAARHGIIDCVACMLAGSRQSLARPMLEFAQETGGGNAATIFGSGMRTSAPMAALVNGSMGHALDYDDITLHLKGHPSVVCLPPALAVGEMERASGRDIMLAYMLAFEVSSAVGYGVSAAYGDDLGWHPTGPLGTLGAAAAASRLLGLDTERTAMAISLAASSACGLRENFGTMTKPFHAGNAGRAGVTAAMLVKKGLTAAMTGLEGRFGFMHAYSGGAGYDLDKPIERLGKRFFLEQPGVEIKKYPACGATSYPLDAMFALLEEHRFGYEDVDSIEVRVDFDPPRALIHSDPKTALEGKFSIQYCIAAALVDGKVGLGQFHDQQVMRPEIRSLLPRISMRRNPGHEGKPSWNEAFNEVHVRLKSGLHLSKTLHRDYSGPVVGVTAEGLDEKFRDCASIALSAPDVERALALLHRLDDQSSVKNLMEIVGQGRG
jgi:2-methylcitrate dehydratase PrpD